MAAAWPAVIAGFPGPENVLVRNIGAVGAAGLLPQPPGLLLGLKVTTHRL
jgi:hypothetical protein